MWGGVMGKPNTLRDIFHKNGLNYSQFGNPKGEYSPTYVSMGLDGFNEAITQIIALIDSGVIGIDEKERRFWASDGTIKPEDYFQSPEMKARNNLRAEMRTNLKKLMGDK